MPTEPENAALDRRENAHRGDTRRPIRLQNILLGAMGASAAFLGAAVMAAWHFRWEAILQVRPDYIAMVYNTALCFFICGLGLLAVLSGKQRAALVCGLFAAAAGVASALQYIIGIDLGIDELLMSHYITIGTSHPGRMAPNTMLCFFLAGTGLAVLGMRGSRRWIALAAGVLGTVTAGLAVNALYGYVSGIEIAYGWGRLIPMAVHTAVGFLAVGTGIILGAWREAAPAGQRVPRWFPILVGAAIVTLSVGQCQAILFREHQHLKSLVARESRHFENEIRSHLERRIESLMRMVKRAEHRPGIPRREWESDALQIAAQDSSFRAIAWVDPSTRVRWFVPEAGNEAARGFQLASEEARRRALEASARERKPRLTPALDLITGGKGFLACLPIDSGGEFHGWIVGVFRVREFFEALLDENIPLRDYSIAIEDGGREIHRNFPEDSPAPAHWGQEIEIAVHGTTWRTKIWPRPTLLATSLTVLPQVVLISGIVLAILLGLAIHFALETRRANHALRDSERRLERIFETVVEGIFIIDRSGRIVYANAGAEKLLRLSRSAIGERTYDDPAWKVTSLDGKPIPGSELPFARVMRTGEPVLGVELEVERGEGARIALSVNAAPLRDSRGEIGGVVVSVNDITHRKEIERLKDEFVSTVSHELRTPLSSLRGFAELMLNRDFSQEKRREFLSIIHKESVRLTSLINDFLDIQRMESGRQRYDFEAVDFATLASEVLTLFGVDAEGHCFRLAIRERIPAVWADADRLRQVLSNLVSNAIKFSPQGSTVTVGARAEEGGVVLWVSDQGIGISPENLPMLFTRFFRADNQETRDVRGTGLGLALVKEIVEGHGGRVWVESEIGTGSTFFVRLPAVPRGASPPTPSLAARGRPEILVIEDDRAFSRLLCEQLEFQGYSATATVTAEEGLEMARRSMPKLVLVDVHLAGRLDGWDLLVNLKSDPVLQSVPVLIISTSEGINARGLALAGCDFLPKPFAPPHFLEAIRRHIADPSGKRILVIDDDPAFRRQVKERLSAEWDGVRIDEASNGKEALALLEKNAPDLLILDLLMPEMDGFEVIRRLRADKRAMNLQVMVITAKDLSEEEKDYIRRGMARLVRKREADLDHISQAVGSILESHAGSPQPSSSASPAPDPAPAPTAIPG